MNRYLPDVDFHRIRPFGHPASRSDAFEELASILLAQGVGDWPSGTRFQRFGNPDGGREGRGVLPNGETWAWQAKYEFEFDSSTASQVTSSVRRVLDTESTLKRYFVVLPIDLPAGDTKTRRSAQTRWDEKVTEWESLARQEGLEVEFVFVGRHHLVSALTEPRNAGRLKYWFDADLMTQEWQHHRLEEAIARAGRRYTPRLHVAVNTVRALDAAGRVDTYVQQWQHVLAQLRKGRQWGWRPPENAGDVFHEALLRCQQTMDDADRALDSMIAGARSTEELPSIETSIDSAFEAAMDVDRLLHQRSLREGNYFVGDAATLYSRVREVLNGLRRGGHLARSVATQAAREKALLLTGRAGVGKTHLFCDVATRRIDEGLPTLLLLGQDFDGRSLLSQFGELTQLGGSLDDVLAVLDASGEAADCVGLLMIDALNESEKPERWRDNVRALVAVARRHEHIAVVVSCRTEFVDMVIGEEQIPTAEHVGFAEATDEAVQRFAGEYGLEPPTFPILNPEFSNPLFLKLTCETLETLGENRFRFGAAGLTTLCDSFLEAVNKRLSELDRCNYDERTDPVSRAIQELAKLDDGVMDRPDVQRVTNEALPDRAWSQSLMRGLITEGVLIEISDGSLTFGYQRLRDVIRAAAIAEKSSDDVREWFSHFDDDLWRERGVLGALAVIVPERLGVEIIDVAADAEGRVSYDVVDSFLEGLILRSPASTSTRTAEIVERILDDGSFSDEVWDRLLRIACVPGHSLNAGWLHTHLAAHEVADRDRGWSTRLVGSLEYDDETAVSRLIEWAWPSDLETRSELPEEVAGLAIQLFAWFLTTSDRRVRDHATKAIVSVAERAPAALAYVLGQFRGVNDPYVIERLAGAASGVVLRTADEEAIRRIADSVLELCGDDWPLHLMTRDFIRRICDSARTVGWSGKNTLPPYGAQWPIPTRPVEEIEALAGPPDYSYGSIWHSLTGLTGDFGRYVLQPALDDVDSDDPRALKEIAERAVFDRVLDLGWTPELFGNIDRGRRGGLDGVVERVGKKYQWIGLYEVLGRIADNLAVRAGWDDEQPAPYQYAEQLVWRDIDPTVLVRKPDLPPAADPPWFSPRVAVFPEGVVSDYPADMSGVPDPLDLLAVADAGGSRWLVLVSNPVWTQPLPPEVEAREVPRLESWMQLHAYLVRVEESAELCEWAHDQDWFGRWMPDIAEPHNVLLGAHPDDPQWVSADGSVEWRDVRAGGPQPADLWQCAAWYGGTGTSRDASADQETRGHVPSRKLFDALGLSKGVDFTWRDASDVALYDPSVVMGGPSTLVMRRDLLSRLTDKGLTLFWTVLVGKELHRGDHIPPGSDYRWVTASASYILDGDTLEQVSAVARRCQPAPTTEHELMWVTKSTER